MNKNEADTKHFIARTLSTTNRNELSPTTESLIEISNNMTYLDLYNQKIKRIPDCIIHLNSLLELNLNDNPHIGDYHIGYISSNLFTLISLELLSLSNSGLTDAFFNITNSNSNDNSNNNNNNNSKSNSIENLINLKTLNIGRNNITLLPSSILTLTTLTSLNITNCNITSIPDTINQLVNLHAFYLNGNEISELPDTLHQLVNLEILDCGNNQIDDIESSSLSSSSPSSSSHTNTSSSLLSLSSLTELIINSNEFSIAPQSIIYNIYTLTILNISECDVITLPDTLGYTLPLLQILDISHNEIINLPVSICECYQLTELWCNNNHITSLPEAIGNHLNNLRELYLQSNNLQYIPLSLGKLQLLHTLYLDDNQLITLPNIFEKMTGLRYGGSSSSSISSSSYNGCSNGGSFTIFDNPTMTSLPDSIRYVKHAFDTHYSEMQHATLFKLVDLKYQRWCDRKLLLLMKPKNYDNSGSSNIISIGSSSGSGNGSCGTTTKNHSAMYEVLFARLDGQYGDVYTSQILVQCIGSYL